MVVMSQPSAWTASTVHDFTDWPFSKTVQAPQLVVSHPIFVPVSSNVSRRKKTSSVRSSTSRRTVSSFTLSVISISLPLLVRLFVGRATTTAAIGQAFEDRRWLTPRVFQYSRPRGNDCAPHALGRTGHVNMAHPEVGERVD